MKILYKWILFLFLLKKGFADWPLACKDNNISFIRNGSCYSYTSQILTFDLARKYCTNNGGDLLIVKSKDLLLDLKTHYQKKQCVGSDSANFRFWIGATDRLVEGNYVNVDGSVFSLQAWASGEPNDRSSYVHQDCLVIGMHSGLVLDDNCEERHQFYCKYSSTPCNFQDIVMPNLVFNGCYKDDTVPYDHTVSVRCQSGYYIHGSSEVTCETNGKWSTLPKCVRGCPEPPIAPNAVLTTHKNIYEIGSKAIYICDEGYVAVNNLRKSHFESHCKENGLWMPTITGCISESKYVIHYVTGFEGHPIFLDCLADTKDEKELKTNEGNHTWMKNSKVLTSGFEGVLLKLNGTLVIQNLTDNESGYYFCFFTAKTIVPTKIGYHVQMKPIHCDDSLKKVERVTTREGESVLLSCPHNATQKFYTWFKDGKLFFETGDEIVYPDGSLYFKNIKFKDQGVYTCQLKEKNSPCTKTMIIHLQVQSTAESICGMSEDNNDHPWTASLWLKDEIAPFCYGTLIDDRWIVTSAQCLSGFNRKKTLNVVVKFRENDDKDILEIPVELVKIHPKFSKKLYVNDIGLLLLKEAVIFTKNVRPICLTATDFTLRPPCDYSSLINGTVVGWGPLEKDDYKTMTLMTESLTVSENEDACSSYSQHHDKIICAMKTVGAKTTFAGDAGSTFEMQYNGRAFLFGIYSWGERSASLGNNDYFTKTSHYISWIKNFLNNKEDEQ